MLENGCIEKTIVWKKKNILVMFLVLPFMENVGN